MKGKIDKEGCLLVERAGKMKVQHCSFTHNITSCSDDCALFGEPFKENAVDINTYLFICHRTWIFDGFEDER